MIQKLQATSRHEDLKNYFTVGILWVPQIIPF